MASMIRRDLYASIPALITAFFFVLISYAINMSPLFIIISVVILLTLNLFYYDFHNHVYRYLVSLPISRKTIVLARYLFALALTVFYVSFIWLFDSLAHSYIYPRLSGILGDLEFEPLSPILILFACLAIITIISVSMPIYYYAQSIARAVTLQLLFFLGFVLGLILASFSSFMERLFLIFLELMDTVPTLSIFTYVVLILSASYFLSVRFFHKRDIS